MHMIQPSNSSSSSNSKHSSHGNGDLRKFNRSAGTQSSSTIAVDAEDEYQVASKPTYIFDKKIITIPASNTKLPPVSAKDESNWNKLSEEAKAQALKTSVRLCLMKAARKESLPRTVLLKELKELGKGEDYSKCMQSILRETQKALSERFGMCFCLLPPDNGLSGTGASTAASAAYMMFNELRSPQLQRLLAENNPDAPYMGFVFVVLHCIHCASGSTEDKCITYHALLDKLRNMDSRITETEDRSADKSSVPSIPELGAHLQSLLTRMVKEKYIQMIKTASNVSDTGGGLSSEQSKIEYRFGSRYFAELGRQQMVTSYFQTIQEPIDAAALQEAQSEEREAHAISEEEAQSESERQEVPEPTNEITTMSQVQSKSDIRTQTTTDAQPVGRKRVRASG